MKLQIAFACLAMLLIQYVVSQLLPTVAGEKREHQDLLTSRPQEP